MKLSSLQFPFSNFLSATFAFIFKYTVKCQYQRLKFRRLGPERSITILKAQQCQEGWHHFTPHKEEKETLFASISLGCYTMARLRPPSEATKHLGNPGNPLKYHNYLPTKLCFLLSHSGAALTPFATKAKKAFFTCKKHQQNIKN